MVLLRDEVFQIPGDPNEELGIASAPVVSGLLRRQFTMAALWHTRQ